MSFSRKHLLYFASGALLPFAFAPLSFWPVAIASPLFLLHLNHREINELNSTLKSFVISNFLYWFGFYSVGVSWVYVSINVYGYTPAPLAAALALVFSAGLALVNCLHAYAYWKLKLHATYLISFPASWVLLEWLRSWLLTGFPWLFNGYAFIDTPLAGIASITGVYGLSFVSITISALFYFCIQNYKQSLARLVGGLVLITGVFFTGFLATQKTWVSIDKEKNLRVHLIQGNIPQHEKWLPENQRKIISIYINLVLNTFESIRMQDHETTQHLVILPEAAMPSLQSELNWLFDNFDKQAKEINTGLVSGIFYDQDAQGPYSDTVYNSIIGIGTASGLYHKQRLVPFGEYVPLEDFIRGLIPFFDLPFSSFERGKFGQKGLSIGNIRISPFICYEILYPQLVYAHANDADIMLTISNDAWFGNSWGPAQHFQMARMRALEQGKYLVRNTNTGTTAIIDPFGEILEAAAKNTRTVLSYEIHGTQGHTPFSLWGHRPILILSACSILFILIHQYITSQKKNKPDQA